MVHLDKETPAQVPGKGPWLERFVGVLRDLPILVLPTGSDIIVNHPGAATVSIHPVWFSVSPLPVALVLYLRASLLVEPALVVFERRLRMVLFLGNELSFMISTGLTMLSAVHVVAPSHSFVVLWLGSICAE